MKHHIYKLAKQESSVDKTLGELRDTISNSGPGVTLQGNRLTVRWTNKKSGEWKQVHMIVLEVEDGEPEPVEIPE